MNLHRIPGLADNYVYANDDYFIASPKVKSDFVNKDKYFFHAGHFSTPCDADCPKANRTCDPKCFVPP